MGKYKFETSPLPQELRSLSFGIVEIGGSSQDRSVQGLPKAADARALWDMCERSASHSFVGLEIDDFLESSTSEQEVAAFIRPGSINSKKIWRSASKDRTEIEHAY